MTRWEGGDQPLSAAQHAREHVRQYFGRTLDLIVFFQSLCRALPVLVSVLTGGRAMSPHSRRALPRATTGSALWAGLPGP